MKESKFLNKLLPTSPDFLPIVREIRRKYLLARGLRDAYSVFFQASTPEGSLTRATSLPPVRCSMPCVPCPCAFQGFRVAERFPLRRSNYQKD
jgi:hypothetical protein